MDYERLSELTAVIAAQAEVAGVLGARLKLGADADQELTRALDGVLAAAGVSDGIDSLDQAQRQALLDRLTLSLKQSIELFESPSRGAGWIYTDPELLLAQGRSSERIPGLIAGIAQSLDGLQLALATEGASILDVGSGVAIFSIACCRVWPAASVVGMDPWEPSMELARRNVTAAGLDDRITLRMERVEDLDDVEAFDLVWLPAVFLSGPVLEECLPRIASSLRAGGWLVTGRQFSSGDGLREALTQLWRLRRAANNVSETELLALLQRSGFDKVRVELSGENGPRFLVGQRMAS